MKITLGRQIEEIKKKNSENEKNLLKNRNSEDINDLDKDDIYFHSNTIKNIKLGNNTVNRIYLNNSIVYELENTIDLNLFHSLIPNTATEIRFLYTSNNPDLTDYQRIGYCDNNNFIEVWNNDTKYIIINPRKNYIYAPVNCSSFLYNFTALTNCVFNNFNTENVRNMNYMFYNCGFSTLNISNFNTEKVVSLHGFVSESKRLRIIELGNFNTQNVTNMEGMFYYCPYLVTIISNTFYKAKHSRSQNMFLYDGSLFGGNGTRYSGNHIDGEYARVDGENGLPGYFTAPANK